MKQNTAVGGLNVGLNPTGGPLRRTDGSLVYNATGGINTDTARSRLG
jgi:hypothetical protein